MEQKSVKTQHKNRPHRWSYVFAVSLIGLLLSILTASVTIGPRFAPLISVGVLIVPLSVSILRNHHVWTRRISILIIAVLTIGLALSVLFLIFSLFKKHTETGTALFRDAALLWASNVIVFAVWYWEVDSGGPLLRHTNQPTRTDFLFPQKVSDIPDWENWIPTFADYVFLAFNTSTAFSPTDTLVLSKRAKVLMVTQSSISLVVVAVLAARAINIA